VLINFAAIVKTLCRIGDYVGRFGGEEFVMLCTDCGIQNAVVRAEEVRRKIADTAQPAIGNQCITASFGVTELQPGDTPETMLRRADRALLRAKDEGRNRVIQLGSGMLDEPIVEQKQSWLFWLANSGTEIVVERRLLASVPLNICAGKLKGFTSDHGAEIVEVIGDHVVLKVDGHGSAVLHRRSDRIPPFYVELTFQETRFCPDGNHQSIVRTLIHVKVRPKRKRDRRRRSMEDRANQLINSVKAYFIAQETNLEMPTGPDDRLSRDSRSQFSNLSP
jgi:hypothetical protein